MKPTPALRFISTIFSHIEPSSKTRGPHPKFPKLEANHYFYCILFDEKLIEVTLIEEDHNPGFLRFIEMDELVTEWPKDHPYAQEAIKLLNIIKIDDLTKEI